MSIDNYKTLMKLSDSIITGLLDTAENHLLSFNDVDPIIKLVETMENIITKEFIKE